MQWRYEDALAFRFRRVDDKTIDVFSEAFPLWCNFTTKFVAALEKCQGDLNSFHRVTKKQAQKSTVHYQWLFHYRFMYIEELSIEVAQLVLILAFGSR